MPTKIKVNGPIIASDEQWIYDLFEIEATSPDSVNKSLEAANGDDVVVSINSDGGYVNSGSEIYTALKSYNGHVTTQIVGLGASAASVVAMGGNKVEMSPTAQLMIHNASVVAMGDKNDMGKAAEFLNTIDRSIVQAYAMKTGKSEADLLSMMNKETWMTANDALEHGFIDAVMFAEQAPKIVASSGQATMLPQQVINSLKSKGLKNLMTSDSITKADVQNMFAEFKNELLAEFAKNTIVEPEPTPEPQPEPKQSVSLYNFFTNL